MNYPKQPASREELLKAEVRLCGLCLQEERQFVAELGSALRQLTAVADTWFGRSTEWPTTEDEVAAINFAHVALDNLDRRGQPDSGLQSFVEAQNETRDTKKCTGR
jgi:hypothetical protein